MLSKGAVLLVALCFIVPREVSTPDKPKPVCVTDLFEYTGRNAEGIPTWKYGRTCCEYDRLGERNNCIVERY